jgi:hypothetical protein
MRKNANNTTIANDDTEAMNKYEVRSIKSKRDNDNILEYIPALVSLEFSSVVCTWALR